MLNFAERILTAKIGATHIFFVGQAGFIIKSASGQMLAIDLYLSDCVERAEGNTGFKRLLPKILSPNDIQFDVVVCTHQHLDHFDADAIPQMICTGRTELLCSKDCIGLTEQLGLGYYGSKIKYVKPFESYDIGDFHIDFVNCDHGTSAPGAVGLVVNVDGKKIYETGDTRLRLNHIDEVPNNIDVLIAPINGAFGNMDEYDCAKFAEVLKPALTIPCHYGMFASHHGDIGKFCEIMTDKRLAFLPMCLGEQYTF